MKIIKSLSLNSSKKVRKSSQIKYVIIHYTGMQSTRVSFKRLRNLSSKVSAHYLIDRNGKVINLVETKKIAWHAGKSKWLGFNNLNKNSIGIELQNKGHNLNYQNFTLKQLASLMKICKKLKKKYKIKSKNFLGHSDIAPLRKKDPGEKFPWKKLSKKGFGEWYSEKDLKGIEEPDEKKDRERAFFANLKKIGYRYFTPSSSKKVKGLVIKAFKRRFEPKSVNDKITLKTFKISSFLAKKP